MDLEELARLDYLEAIRNSWMVSEYNEYQELHKKYIHLSSEDISKLLVNGR